MLKKITLTLYSDFTGDNEYPVIIVDESELENMDEFIQKITSHYNNNFYDCVKFKLGINTIEDVADDFPVISCAHCGISIPKEDGFFDAHYDTPWSENHDEYTSYFCSYTCMDAFDGQIYSKDFNYFTCYDCGRKICEQNPRNGWHVQFREYDDYEKICLSCYQKNILENGIDREVFENGRINGMFLESGIAEENGYEQVDGFVYNHIVTREDARKFSDKALELIDSGKKVIVDYESMAIGGSEGYVTLLAK